MLGRLRDWLNADHSARQNALNASLERIREIDPFIQAWVHVAPQAPAGDGQLYGVPFGVKDVIETKDLVTEFGSPIYKDQKGTADAALVRELRTRGAVLLGKTHTAAFGYQSPPPTRNPHNLKHTPGGSSSGSAAAVAACMVPFALGAQTCGSILRPASYCGITGFKPSFGLLPMEGILPLATSLDTAGLFTHTAEDMQLLWESLGYLVGQGEALRLGAAQAGPKVDREMETAFQWSIRSLREAGFFIQPVRIDTLLREVDVARQIVMDYEGARTHQQRFEEYGFRLGPIANLVCKGKRIPEHRYKRAKESIFRLKQEMAKVFEKTPVILTPAATGSAPLGHSFTGDPKMNAPWTALGAPAISIPIPGRHGLPLGLQLTSHCGHDGTALRAAVFIEKALRQCAADASKPSEATV
jgi:Asp-tRNA(Asn)/Glu-tRNA(Gln) amidotransferase A subunit family amidase